MISWITSSAPKWTSVITLVLLICTMYTSASDGSASYNNIKTLEDSLTLSKNYSTTLRPVNDQKQLLTIDVTFSLVAVVSIDTVKQELITNSFLFLFWRDEVHQWDADDYDGLDRLFPTPEQIWRPRLLLINTLDKRDPFDDDYSHVFHGHDGTMGWVPGGLFRTYCALKLEKFPFDVQNCQIQMCPMSHTNVTIQFRVGHDPVNLAFYYPNPGWELQNVSVSVEQISVVPQETFSCPSFSIQLKRRPNTIVMNVIIPVVLLSVLNNLVFIIPIESGEKVSYSITVLLSLSVFLSMVSTMTPQVSDTVPALTKYLFVLLVSSVLTVAATISTVYLHHKDEKEETAIKSKQSFQHAFTKFKNVKQAIAPLDPKEDTPPPSETQPVIHNCPDVNRYRMVSRHINKFFFVTMNIITFVMTIWYFSFATS